MMDNLECNEGIEGVYCIWCGKDDFKTPRFTELREHLRQVHGVVGK